METPGTMRVLRRAFHPFIHPISALTTSLRGPLSVSGQHHLKHTVEGFLLSELQTGLHRGQEGLLPSPQGRPHLIWSHQLQDQLPGWDLRSATC